MRPLQALAEYLIFIEVDTLMYTPTTPSTVKTHLLPIVVECIQKDAETGQGGLAGPGDTG